MGNFIASKGSFLRVTNLFVTWPQCVVPKEECGRLLMEKYDPYWTVVVQEKHKTSGVHLHAVLKLRKRTRVLFSDLDAIVGKRGNYQAARSLPDVLKYVVKEDPTPYCKGIDVKKYLEEFAKKRSHKGDEVMKLLKDGGDLDTIVDRFPGYALVNKRKIEDMQVYLAKKKSKTDLKDWEPIGRDMYRDIEEDPVDVIANWLSKNVLKDRVFKQKQLYVWGPTNMGKSSLIMSLAPYLRLYSIPHHNSHEDYEDGMYDLAFMDEFKAQKKIQWLNAWLDGGIFSLKGRYKQVIKTQNIPTIILSNYSLVELYSDSTDAELATIRGRLLIVNVQSFIDIFE